VKGSRFVLLYKIIFILDFGFDFQKKIDWGENLIDYQGNEDEWEEMWKDKEGRKV
jgi:hypothetical protein